MHKGPAHGGQEGVFRFATQERSTQRPAIAVVTRDCPAALLTPSNTRAIYHGPKDQIDTAPNCAIETIPRWTACKLSET